MPNPSILEKEAKRVMEIAVQKNDGDMTGRILLSISAASKLKTQSGRANEKNPAPEENRLNRRAE